MPIVTLFTNLVAENAAKLDANFRRSFIALVAETLGKPQEGVALIVQNGSDLCQLGPSDKATAILNIKSIGNLRAEENVVHAKRVTDFITGCLPVEPSRVLIHFENLQRHEVAKNGISIQAMLEGK